MNKIKQIGSVILVYGGIFVVAEIVCKLMHSSTNNKFLVSTITGTVCGCQVASILMKRERYTVERSGSHLSLFI